ncbi:MULTISPECIES: hypothetical protein [unclassified Mesorhizobium]|uniref:hypothetical protein n=1 Tax=unclassified Mesorhizobium TaxID=325217 RepID=UPI0010936A75|nr:MULTISPECIES: hypothetical protein [unclassified Mesorhizobium]TGT90863.1 hypothetical protein EN804_05880 [Mesorhizobium sp. M8A.F.Ca.ET.161.01.1.1]TGV43857.1 hypothetical protein EN785_07665 [Mesorhizobium sp. M8A.F.Ca.ET.142.01.1.1]TGW07069.1 hypothetical protein EN788_38785 [Mesorhizobium sp. M2D.F.Ca.ET.145.01.1.1]
MEPNSQSAEPKPAYTGRPRKDDNFKFYDGALNKLLLDKLPSACIKFGRIDTLALAKATGNARFTIYRWLNEQRLSKNAIRSLLKVSAETEERKKKGKLKKDDLIPFFDLGDDL